MEEINKFELSYKRIYVHFVPERNMHINAWIGAVLRNNFLVNTSKVFADDGLSLYQHIEEFSLSIDNPYYSHLAGGFPKGVWLDCRELARVNGELYAGQVYSFSIIMMGWCAQYAHLAVSAVEQIFLDGIGHPKVRANIVNVSDNDDERSSILYSNFVLQNNAPKYATVKIMHETPICLFRQRNKKDSSVSYQDKLNGFPSFYQFMRSIVSRVNTLGMLYGNGPLTEDVDEFITHATDAYLSSADLHYTKLHSTPKKGRSNVYVMDGYVGSIVWSNVPTVYLPILAFATGISVGYNIPFGLGAYTIDVL
jgi:tetrahydromethanopterin S-methyltransferase subunit B